MMDSTSEDRFARLGTSPVRTGTTIGRCNGRVVRSLSAVRGRCKHDKLRCGASTLEFALVFPVFLVLVFGLIEVGRAMMVISLLNNAARIGCREAILPTATGESINKAVDRVLQDQGVEGYTVSVLVNNQSVALSTAVKNDLITVHIQVPHSKVSWIPGINLVSTDLHGKYVLPRE